MTSKFKIIDIITGVYYPKDFNSYQEANVYLIDHSDTFSDNAEYIISEVFKRGYLKLIK